MALPIRVVAKVAASAAEEHARAEGANELEKCRDCGTEVTVAAARRRGWGMTRDGFVATVCNGCIAIAVLEQKR